MYILLSWYCRCDGINTIIGVILRYHAIDLYTGLIISDTTNSQRKLILQEFSQYSKKTLICSVRILDEYIDIAECDSVFLTSPQTNNPLFKES